MKTVLLALRWVCAFLGWALFFFWWKKAYSGTASVRAVTISLLVIAAVIVAAVAYAAVWIFHNKRVARRGKRGFVSYYKSPRFEADALGRSLSTQHGPEDNLIAIRHRGNRKEYVPFEDGSVPA